MLKLYYYSIPTLKTLMPYLNLNLKDKIDNRTVLFHLESCDLERFKLFFDESKRRKIPIENELMEHYIKLGEVEIVDFLKGYIEVEPNHIELALELRRQSNWFVTLKTKSCLYPKILIDAIYNPVIFETLFERLRIIDKTPLEDFKPLFYYDKIMRTDFAVKFLLDTGVPKPPLGYLTISPLNLNKYYADELEFIQKLFAEEGIGRIIKSYILP